jgi:two-component system chemotaxis sensor kinase CheA
MDLSAFHNQFREETTENIRTLNDGLLAIEKLAGSDEQAAQHHVHTIFRAMHTVKGSSRVLGFNEVSRLAHSMENALGAVRSGSRSLDRELADLLLRAGDTLLGMVHAAVDAQPFAEDIEPLVTGLEPAAPVDDATPAADSAPAAAPPAQAAPSAPPAAHATTSPPASPGNGEAAPEPLPPQPVEAPAAPAVRNAGRQTVRVRVDRLDRLINLTGELVVGEQMLEHHMNRLRELDDFILRQETMLGELDLFLREVRLNHVDRQNLDRYFSELFDSLDHARHMLSNESEQFDEYLNQHQLLLGDMEQEVMSVRLLPISTLFNNIPRAVRDLARAVEKDIDLQLHGENTELDRKLLELLNDPLLHLVRNAIDHGIEPPDERERVGKPRTGRLLVQAQAFGGEVRISISDDGRGMDPAQMREIAVRKRLISAENAALLSDREALDLVFMPGFSSAQMITDISGRGVGMDVVRTNLTELGGQVLLESESGQGTRITLQVPLTLITTRVLLVRIGVSTFALPASGCRGTAWIHQDQIRTVEGQAIVEHKDRTLPLLRMADLLNVEAPPPFQTTHRMPAILLGNGQRALALLVDRLLDEREAVVKPLGTILEHLCRSQPTRYPYSGAIQPGDRTLVLLLNPTALTRMAGGKRMAGPEASRPELDRQYQLLVTDDSFTTRELLRSILESAGYDVTIAIDGMDALDKLRAHSYDLLVSDVEMPRVNGFQLTSRLRNELGIETMPVVIMTSLASEEHRRQGLEAGAQAYIVKSQFNQDGLLQVIQQLLGHELVAGSA